MAKKWNPYTYTGPEKVPKQPYFIKKMGYARDINIYFPNLFAPNRPKNRCKIARKI